eukprot:3935077-Pleurochrysis_carterae.AAC.3
MVDSSSAAPSAPAFTVKRASQVRVSPQSSCKTTRWPGGKIPADNARSGPCSPSIVQYMPRWIWSSSTGAECGPRLVEGCACSPHEPKYQGCPETSTKVYRHSAIARSIQMAKERCHLLCNALRRRVATTLYVVSQQHTQIAGTGARGVFTHVQERACQRRLDLHTQLSIQHVVSCVEWGGRQVLCRAHELPDDLGAVLNVARAALRSSMRVITIIRNLVVPALGIYGSGIPSSKLIYPRQHIRRRQKAFRHK